MRVEEQVPLAPLTTFRIGGEARYFARVISLEDLREALTQKHTLPLFVLGGGSNMLIGDSGWPGLVVKIELRGIELENTVLVAAAGELWDELVARAVREELWGLENLSGIPGTVGGAVVQNIGAYGAALSQTLLWAEAYDTQSEQVRRFTKEECAFGYRDSIFKQARGRYVVLRAAFALSRAQKPALSYRDLRERFVQNAAPALSTIREAVLDIRRGKFPDLTIEGTAGSFFKNPILPEREALRLKEVLPDMPLFPLPESEGFKVPLAYLLDKGLGLKGLSVGAARLFEKQPLVIATKFGSSARDVRALARQVQEKIFDAYGISIEPEVCMLDAR